jgi:hydrogenase maturation protein HypF
VKVRQALRVEGTVQGVGFRPYVHRLAHEIGVGGLVGNDERGVFVEVEGDAAAVATFVERLPREAPPLAVVEAVSVRDLPPTGQQGFAIVASERHGAAAAPVTPDAATCDDCLAELRDPADRRYRYAFINCTNCGPRFTIVRDVPYDRPATTMAGFTMCAACQAEYDDPSDRRFHAQPNACPECGPRLSLPIEAAVAMLDAGQILAVKGLGGYHLACRADAEDAVAALRARKHREDRPFALMAPDLETARTLAFLGAEEEALLLSPARPIVLAPRRPAAAVAPSVAPRSTELGVMLPYTPLHHLLVERTLVLTSGNVSDDPIAFRDEDALERLAGIADAFLVHDRPIHTRTDDSVVRAGAVLRRSRGYVPGALRLPEGPPVLAVGAELKNTFCLAKGGRAWVGHHIGDLQNAETLSAFTEGIAHFERLFAVTPEVVAHDLHPDYLSTTYALDRDRPLVGVQHHHAHLAAVLAEHGERGPAAGAIYDGTGYGTDGTVWGGEILLGDLRSFERVDHLRPVRLPGGDRAVREPWRMAIAWMVAAGIDPPVGTPLEADVARLATSDLAPVTTSMGRLFDAVAALCGVRDHVTYEGQAAIELEALADPEDHGTYTADLDGRQLILDVLADLRIKTPVPVISTRFHRAIARATAAALAETGCETAVLSGGVFQNRLLLRLTRTDLQSRGLRVLTPERLPANDGGISYGQAAVATTQ